MSLEPSTCSRCGSSRLVPGYSSVRFQPLKVTKKGFYLDKVVTVAATVCLNCGTVDLHADPAEVIDLAGEPSPSSEAT